MPLHLAPWLERLLGYDPYPRIDPCSAWVRWRRGWLMIANSSLYYVSFGREHWVIEYTGPDGQRSILGWANTQNKAQRAAERHARGDARPNAKPRDYSKISEYRH